MPPGALFSAVFIAGRIEQADISVRTHAAQPEKITDDHRIGGKASGK
jgi:hypothetical protein